MKEHKFKVGDEVRVKPGFFCEGRKGIVKGIPTIEEPAKEMSYHVYFEDAPTYRALTQQAVLMEHTLELVSSASTKERRFSKSEKQKSSTDKRQYDINYIRTHGGRICPKCGNKGRGIPAKDGGWTTCDLCGGLGWIEEKKEKEDC